MILFLALNLLSTNLSVGLRVDLTEKRLYTLSTATRTIIARIDEPVTLRLFYSSDFAAAVPSVGSYAQRVQDLLREYAELSGGRIRLEIIDPTPFSEAEDRAVAFGLQKVPLDAARAACFLGWSAPTPPMTSKPSLFFRPIASRSWNMIFRA